MFLRGIITDSEKNSVTFPSYADYKYVVFTFIFTSESPWKSHISHLKGLGSMTIFFSENMIFGYFMKF